MAPSLFRAGAAARLDTANMEVIPDIRPAVSAARAAPGVLRADVVAAHQAEHRVLRAQVERQVQVSRPWLLRLAVLLPARRGLPRPRGVVQAGRAVSAHRVVAAEIRRRT